MKRKKYISIGIIVLIVICLSSYFFFFRKNSKFYVYQYVKQSHVGLEQFAENRLKENDNTEQKKYHGWDVSSYDTTNMVEFIVSDFGIGSSTTYKGFYYSPDDEPLGFQGTDVDWQPEGDGWKWKESEGDNFEYTEKIMDKWYWFEMHF